jgi:hypothetical protein
MTNARQRMLYGRTSPCMPSRFLGEIPEENLDWQGKPGAPEAPLGGEEEETSPPWGSGPDFGSGGFGRGGAAGYPAASAPRPARCRRRSGRPAGIAAAAIRRPGPVKTRRGLPRVRDRHGPAVADRHPIGAEKSRRAGC